MNNEDIKNNDECPHISPTGWCLRGDMTGVQQCYKKIEECMFRYFKRCVMCGKSTVPHFFEYTISKINRNTSIVEVGKIPYCFDCHYDISIIASDIKKTRKLKQISRKAPKIKSETERQRINFQMMPIIELNEKYYLIK